MEQLDDPFSPARMAMRENRRLKKQLQAARKSLRIYRKLIPYKDLRAKEVREHFYK